MHIINTNSRTSTHWKLNFDSGKVQTAAAAVGADDELASADPLMSILTNKVTLGNGGWKLEGENSCTENCHKQMTTEKSDNESVSSNENNTPPPQQQKRLVIKFILVSH